MKVNDFKVVKTSETLLVQGLKGISAEDQLLKLGQSADQFVGKLLNVIVGHVQVSNSVAFWKKLSWKVLLGKIVLLFT